MKHKTSLKQSRHWLLVISCAFVISQFAPKTQAQILDGGFENVATNVYIGNLGDGWMTTQGTIQIISSGTYLGAVAHSGNHFADLNYASTLNSLTQTIPTIPNQTYILSYWNADTSPDPLTVSFGGSAIFSGNAPTAGVTSPGDYGHYMFTVTPTSSTALLSFTGHYTGPGGSLGTILDDVSLTPIPEPSSSALVVFGILVVLGSLIYRRSNIPEKLST
jgi:hypothetical protein